MFLIAVGSVEAQSPLFEPRSHLLMAFFGLEDLQPRRRWKRTDRPSSEPPHVRCDRGLQQVSSSASLEFRLAGKATLPGRARSPDQVADVISLGEPSTDVSGVTPTADSEHDGQESDHPQHASHPEPHAGQSHRGTLHDNPWASPIAASRAGAPPSSHVGLSAPTTNQSCDPFTPRNRSIWLRTSGRVSDSHRFLTTRRGQIVQMPPAVVEGNPPGSIRAKHPLSLRGLPCRMGSRLGLE